MSAFMTNINLSNEQSPCRKCGDRKVGCHSSCEEYSSFRARREKVYGERQLANKISQTMYEMGRK